MSGYETPTFPVPGQVRTPKAPGGESAGPELAQLEQRFAQVQRTLELLAGAAMREERKRMQQFHASAQTGETGDCLLELFSVPAGATGYLTWAAVDEAGVTPASPDTSANLYAALYAASGSGISDPTQVIANGSLLDAIPSAPTVNAQIPFTFLYGHWRAAPVLRGPSTFYLVVDAANAGKMVTCRGAVYVEQPDH